MPVGYNQYVSFNKGLISKFGTARIDVKRVAMSAEIMTNWMPRVLGSMMLRPGSEFVGASLSGLKPIYIPFIYNDEQTAILEITSSGMRIRDANEDIVTIPAVTTAVVNGTFTTDLTGWTNADQAGCSSYHIGGDSLGLLGTGTNYAIEKQHITVSGANIDKEHNLAFVVLDGFVTIRVGSTSGGDELIAQTDLRPGNYSFNFTPHTDIYIQLMSSTRYQSQLKSCLIQASGDKILTTPWAAGDLQNIRVTQSADVIFVACKGYQQRRISRRTADSRSWGVDLYQPPDGPFRLANTGPVTLSLDDINYNISITANQPVFYPAQAGGLIRITSEGQVVSSVLAAGDTFTDPIMVTGVGAGQRTFAISLQGTWSGTMTLQQSIGSPGAWVDIETFTSAVNTGYADGLDNQIIYYRIGFKGGNYVSGSPVALLSYTNGSITGIARLTNYVSSTVFGAQVLKSFGQITPTSDWAEGAWSNYRGWPTSVALVEGRLGWAGKGNFWGSVSDAYESFDDTVEGDAAPLLEAIGEGPVDIINWMLPLLRLILGGQAAEHSVRSSAIDTPLTPTNFSIKAPSSRGSTNVPAIKMDMGGFFVDKSGTRLFELNMENAYYSYDYNSVDKTQFCPEITEMGISRLGIQRTLDTRIHSIRTDGDVGILVYDSLESVQAWVQYHTAGLVHDVFVMPNPGFTEDKVYYSVARVINGSTVYCLERWARENECQGGALNKQIDCHVVYTGAATGTITASHLPNTTVQIWGDGKDLGTLTLDSSGVGTLADGVTVSNYVVGLGYTAQFMSTKMADNRPDGTPGLTQKSNMDHLAVVMQNTHYQGLQYGSSFDTLDDLPLVENGAITPADTIWPEYDQPAFEINDIWNSDTRLCLQAASPRPCTVKYAGVKSYDGTAQ